MMSEPHTFLDQKNNSNSVRAVLPRITGAAEGTGEGKFDGKLEGSLLGLGLGA